jgi:hypothetical protein
MTNTLSSIMATADKNKSWKRVHVDPWWVSHRSLDYVNEPFNDPQSLKLWQELGYTQTRFTGDMYDMRRCEPGWIDGFRHFFKWQHFSWSVYRMTPGCVLPCHGDTYKKFIEIHAIKQPEHICRAVIFLESWQSGHYFEINSCPITSWLAGDGVIWRYDTPHIAANVGQTDRYTLQITGVPDEDPFLQ